MKAKTRMADTTYLFVGENPSRRAEDIGASWETKQLAGKTLAGALDEAGVPESSRRFINLFGDTSKARAADTRAARRRIKEIRDAAGEGLVVVGLGRRVQRVLTRHSVAHLAMAHPATRGTLRRTENYRAHVRSALAAAEN